MTVLFIIACAICAILVAVVVAEVRKENNVKHELDEAVERLTNVNESLKSLAAENEQLESGFSRVVAREFVTEKDLEKVFERDMQKQIHKRLASKIGYAILRSYPGKVITDNNGLPVYSVAFYVKPASTEE